MNDHEPVDPSAGLGLALNFQPSLIMLNRYFSEKRPLANGLAAAGSPVALCCLSPLGQILQYQYGWRGGFLILGGILLNCCVCGALMKPLVATKTVKAEDKEEKMEGAEKKSKPKLLDFSVFKDRGFVIYTVAASIMVLGLFVPPVFVVSYAKELGNEDTKSALLLTILGFIDIFARPVCGIIAGLKWVRPRCVYLFSFAMIFNGVTDLVGSQVRKRTLYKLSASHSLHFIFAHRPRTTHHWWFSASSLASPTAWWELCSLRFSWR